MKSISKKLKYLCCFLSICMSSISCSKEWETEAPLTYTIEGHLYQDCSRTPMANFELELFRDDYNSKIVGSSKAGVIQTSITDSSGYFKFRYQDQGGIDLYIRKGLNYLLNHIPLRKTFNNLEIYLQPTINIEYYLEVKTPYNEMDTLNFSDLNYGSYSIPGPFKSGFLMRLDNMSTSKMSLRQNDFRIGYVLLPWKGVSHYTQFTIENYCDNVIPVTLTIE